MFCFVEMLVLGKQSDIFSGSFCNFLCQLCIIKVVTTILPFIFITLHSYTPSRFTGCNLLSTLSIREAKLKPILITGHTHQRIRQQSAAFVRFPQTIRRLKQRSRLHKRVGTEICIINEYITLLQPRRFQLQCFNNLIVQRPPIHSARRGTFVHYM